MLAPKFEGQVAVASGDEFVVPPSQRFSENLREIAVIERTQDCSSGHKRVPRRSLSSESVFH